MKNPQSTIIAALVWVGLYLIAGWALLQAGYNAGLLP